MDFKTDLWDEAENGFQKWLSRVETNSNELTGILQATFLAYRKNLRENLTRVQDNSIRFLEKRGFVSESDFLYEHKSSISFRIAQPRDKQEAERWEREEREQNQKDNKRIVNALLLGDQSTVNKLYEWEFPEIVRLILKNSGNLENAKDVFQDALVVLIENVLNKKIDLTESFSSYLYGICRILWLNQLKKQKKAIQFRDEYSHFQTDFVFVDIENQPANYENIFVIIKSMGNPCKQLLEYYYYRNMDWETISEELGYASAGSARNQKYKCLERIRKQLAEMS